MFTNSWSRYILLVLGSLYLALFMLYTNKMSVQSVLRRERENRWIERESSAPSYEPNNEIKANDIYLRELKEYRNGVIKIEETKVIETENDLIIYKSLKKTAKSANNDYKSNTENDYQRFFENDNLKEKSKKKKYIFSLRYYEQLSAATKNLLSLVSLATHYNRHVVMPYVNNSRFSGLRLGVTLSRYLEIMRSNITEDEYLGPKFNNLDAYFDVDHLQSKLRQYGYTNLETFQNFRKDCRELDVVVHFMYADKQSDSELARWYKITPEKYQIIKQRAIANGGFTECNFLKKSKIETFLNNIQVNKYICVDPEVIKTASALEKLVLRSSQCVGVLSWKGNGTNRTHFKAPHSVHRTLTPSNLKHNKRLMDIAYRYIREVIKRPYISVHVRSERHLIWKSLENIQNCITKLGVKINHRKMKFNLKKIFVANDLEEAGSGTLRSKVDDHDRRLLRIHLYKTLNSPFLLDPAKYSLYDRGEIAIVEMHILSMGESLFTVGEGNFQEWVINLFLLHNAEDRSLVRKICEINSKSYRK